MTQRILQRLHGAAFHRYLASPFMPTTRNLAIHARVQSTLFSKVLQPQWQMSQVSYAKRAIKAKEDGKGSTINHLGGGRRGAKRKKNCSEGCPKKKSIQGVSEKKKKSRSVNLMLNFFYVFLGKLFN